MTRLRFSLRTFFVLIALLAIPCAWVAREVALVRQRKAVVEWMLGNGRHPWFVARGEESPTWLRQLLGDPGAIDLILHPSAATPEDIARAKAAFPEAIVVPGQE